MTQEIQNSVKLIDSLLGESFYISMYKRVKLGQLGACSCILVIINFKQLCQSKQIIIDSCSIVIQISMKKIIFVQKEDSNFDPVAAFFNKKAPSVPKSLNSTNKPSATNKKAVPEIQKIQKPSLIRKNEQVTPKIGKKGQYQPPNIPKPNPLRQQGTKNREFSQANTKKESKNNLLKEPIPRVQTKKSIEDKVQKVQKQDSIDKMKQEPSKPVKREKVDGIKNESLLNKIKQLEQRELEYQRKIQEFEAKEQKYIKNEQKLTKIQKDMKLASQKSKQGQAALQKLKQKQNQIKQMLQGNSIPFNRKRQVILNNKVRELKRMNRQLVMRIKNYKGSDLVELSTQQNRQEITNELYTIDVDSQLKPEMNAEMESLLVQLINKLKNYIEGRVKEKGEKSVWNVEQTFLLQLINLSEKISLNYLNNYDLTQLPKSNQQAISSYSILQEYKNTNQIKKVIDKYGLNFILAKQNLDIINSIQGITEQQNVIKSQLKGRKKKEDNKYNHNLQIFERNKNFIQILFIQSICQLQFLKSWLQKVTSKINSQLGSIQKMMGEIKNIVQLGSSAKQSLYLYLQTNIGKLESKFPSLKLQMKQIHLDFNQLQRSNTNK